MTHPLQPFVLDLLKTRPHLDEAILGPALSGCVALMGPRGNAATRAYRLVAYDVLTCMVADRVLTQHDVGWYVLRAATPREAP